MGRFIIEGGYKLSGMVTLGAEMDYDASCRELQPGPSPRFRGLSESTDEGGTGSPLFIALARRRPEIRRQHGF